MNPDVKPNLEPIKAEEKYDPSILIRMEELEKSLEQKPMLEEGRPSKFAAKLLRRKKVKIYECDDCEGKYSAKSPMRLAHHMGMLHLGPTNFLTSHACDLCGYATFRKFHLSLHMRIHDFIMKPKRAPVECDDCGRVLRSRDKLAPHVTICSRETMPLKYVPMIEDDNLQRTKKAIS